MNEFLYKRHKPEPTINWPEMVFYAEAEGEPFEEVSVITLKSFYADKCYDLAFEQIEYNNAISNVDNLNLIQQKAYELMDSGKVTVQEFVEVYEDCSVVVAIDANTVTDKEVDIALGYLAKSNIPGVTYFGKHQTYSSTVIKEGVNQCNK